MPAFMWTGNQTLYGTSAELYRVEIFTDKQCLNRVYTGAVVGSPSWAPRLNGPLALPTDDARSPPRAPATSSTDGVRATGEPTYDRHERSPQRAGRRPPPDDGSVPDDDPAAAGDDASPGPTGAGGARLRLRRRSGISAGALGAPVDLWDTNWPESGYYWTVVPVVAAAALGSSAIRRAARRLQGLDARSRSRRPPASASATRSPIGGRRTPTRPTITAIGGSLTLTHRQAGELRPRGRESRSSTAPSGSSSTRTWSSRRRPARRAGSSASESRASRRSRRARRRSRPASRRTDA